MVIASARGRDRQTGQSVGGEMRGAEQNNKTDRIFFVCFTINNDKRKGRAALEYELGYE